MADRCANCEAPLGGRYCHDCGQEARALLTAGAFTRLFVRDALDVDGRTLRTLRSILTQPGAMTRAYVEGRRREQVPPGRLYLTIAALYFFAAPRIGSGELSFVSQGGNDIQTLSVGPLGWDSEPLLLILIPLWAVAVRGVIGRGRTFEEAFVFSVHYHGFFFFVMLALAVVLAVLEALSLPGLAVTLSLIGLLLPLPYVLIGYRRAFDVSRRRAVALGTLAFFAQLFAGQMLYLAMTGG